MEIETLYVSANCNQTPSAADCNKSNIIAYAAGNAVLLYDPHYGSGGKVIKTLTGHTKRVNSVRWIQGSNGNNQELISGSADGTVRIWHETDEEYKSVVLKSDELDKILTVSLVDGYYKGNKTIVCCSAACTTSIKIWCRKENEEFSIQQVFNFGKTHNPMFCVGLRIALLPKQNKLIIACGMDNSKIELIVEEKDSWNKYKTLVGHDDWVRGLDFTTDSNNDLLLASGSQDFIIRLWRLTEVIDNSEYKTNFEVGLESVLAGHENWIFSVSWSSNNMELLSASMDKSVILWQFDPETGLWTEKIRVGEVGGNTLGFYGAFFTSNDKQIISYSYHGAFHIWARSEDNSWSPSVTIGGHFRDVSDIAWEPEGEFLYSISYDQTTRIHAPWQQDDKEPTWHEIARPQVHGFDLNTLAVISRYSYAAGADEKVIRTFTAPETFIKNFHQICQLNNINESGNAFIPKGASVPSLGLSNKAVYENTNYDNNLSVENQFYPEETHFVAQDLTEPPTEETLLQNTLWPETQKIYGHGYEIFALAASPDGKYLASACKSTKPEHSAIFLWDTSNFVQLQTLKSHNLTVVQMEFSPDSNNLLSVSRDRRWSVFTKIDGNFQLAGCTDKTNTVHTRIIWTCAWTYDSKYFTTGSRDGKLVFWTKNPDKKPIDSLKQYEKILGPFDFRNAITAVGFAPYAVEDGYLLATGFENGHIYFHLIKDLQFVTVVRFDERNAHNLTVRRLSFRSKLGKAGKKQDNLNNVIQCASCSSDTCVRIYNISLLQK